MFAFVVLALILVAALGAWQLSRLWSSLPQSNADFEAL